MISIFVNTLTPRINYTFQLIFNQLLGVKFNVITTIDQFQNCNGFKLSYGDQIIDKELFIHSNQLLFNKGVDAIIPNLGEYNGLPVLFMNKNNETCLPFDFFAASFYLVTRYEEYNKHSADQHGRFQASSSIAFKNEFLQLPIINLWVNEFKKILSNQFPAIRFQPPTFKFIPSYDIDHAWAFKNKGPIRIALQLAKSLVSLNFKKAALIANVLQNKREDPFYTFPYLSKMFETNSVIPIFFFLLGQYGKYDKNVSIKSKNLQLLIQQLSQQFTIGIHPSYRAHLNPTQLNSEQQTLHQFTKQPITHSRQHFLRLSLPESYRILIQSGITHDYTMGYADYPGFRAGIAHPFLWYDLLNETVTNLTIHPFQFMDVTLRIYQQQTPEQAKTTIKELIEATSAVGGQLISLWHNSSLSDFEGWEGWRAVHDYVFECAAAQENSDE